MGSCGRGYSDYRCAVKPYPHPYEALKALTRTNKKMTEETIHAFIQTLNVSDSVKAELMAINPHNYTGI